MALLECSVLNVKSSPLAAGRTRKCLQQKDGSANLQLLLLSGYSTVRLLETAPSLGEEENLIRKRGERRTICLFTVVMEQIHILMKISASSAADLSHTEEMLQKRQRDTNTATQTIPCARCKRNHLPLSSIKPPRMLQHPTRVAPAGAADGSTPKLPITCQTHIVPAPEQARNTYTGSWGCQGSKRG